MNIQPKYEDVVAQLEHWRDLALQFDNHRMTAIWHLKTLVSDGAHYDTAAAFLSEPPATATDIQQRLTVAEQRAGELGALLHKWRHGRNMTLKDCASLRDRTDAALKPAEEGEGS